MPTQTAVLRRDRILISIALALLTGLAWSYLLCLSADMSMVGMDMTGFRMIPSGMGLMIPADMPWRAMEFAFVFAMWTVMMVGMMTPSAVPMILMYARWLFPCLDRAQTPIARAWRAVRKRVPCCSISRRQPRAP